MKKSFKIRLLALLLGVSSLLFPACNTQCDHTYGEWATTKKATCLAEGEEKRTCARCDEEESRTIPALGHDYSAWRVVSTADCSRIGLTERLCAVCGYIEYESTPQDSNHTLKEKSRVEPTCTKDGSVVFYCACANVVERVRLPNLGGHIDEDEDLRCDTCEEALHRIPVTLILEGNATAQTEPFALIGEESGGFAKVTMGENSILREARKLYPAEGYAGNLVCDELPFIYEWELPALTQTYLYGFRFENPQFGEVQECLLRIADRTETALVVVKNHFIQRGNESCSNQVHLYWTKRIDPDDSEAMNNPDNITVIPARFAQITEDLWTEVLRYTDEEGNILSTEADYGLVVTEEIVRLHIYYLQVFTQTS